MLCCLCGYYICLCELCQWFLFSLWTFFVDFKLFQLYSICRKEGEIEVNEGERVKAIRKALGLTLEEFGTKVGVGKTAISNIERCNRNVTEQMRKSICREFNASYDYLVYGEEPMFKDLSRSVLDTILDTYNCDELDRRIITEYLKLNASSRKVFKDYIVNILKEDQ